jgi:hypothetical protein
LRVVGRVGVVADDEILRVLADKMSWREVDGHVVALDLNTSTYVTTNESGALLWKRLIDGSSVADLVSELQREYDVEEADARRDVEAFVHMLRDAALLADGR